MQVVGMLGLAQSFRRTSGWALRLMFGRIERLPGPPASALPMRGVGGTSACHEPPAAPPPPPARRGRAVPLPVAVG